VLVGHSYAGSVISHPIFTKHALKSLVFISAFLQDSGEAAGELNGRWPGSKLGETTTIVRLYPGGNDLYSRQRVLPRYTRVICLRNRLRS
jgi:hypothetical protein